MRFDKKITQPSDLRRRQLYYKLQVVVLRVFVSPYLAAFSTLVYYYIALLRVGQYLYRLKSAAALTGSVTRIYIDVKRPQTVRTVVSRRISERLDLTPAMSADKSVVVFCESL